MKISKNFYLKELTASGTAERLGIDNTPGEEELASLVVLTHKVLQPVREHYGVVSVSSGFRCLELNRKIGSSDKSQHVRGEAVDFECYSVDNKLVAGYIQEYLDFDQLILEFYKVGYPNSGWIHCSYNRVGDNRKKVMTAVRGAKGTEYKDGFVS